MPDDRPDPATWEQLLAHGEFLRRLARSLVRDPSLADDVVQATWLAAVVDRPYGGKALGGWLRRVAGHVVHQWHRTDERRLRRERVAAAPEEDPAALAAAVAQFELQQRVVAAVAALHEKYRAVITLHFLNGLPLTEVAQTLGLPPATVRTQLGRALEQLRIHLDAAHGGDRETWRHGLVLLAGAGGTTVAGAALALVATLLLMIGGVWWSMRGVDHDSPEAHSASATELADALPDDVREFTERRLATADVPAQMRSVVTGRVVDSLGRPIEGARVELFDWWCDPETATTPLCAATTDHAGHYGFDDVPGGSLRRVVTKSGYVATNDGLALDAAHRTERGTTTFLLPARELEGVVRAPSGAVVPLAWVVVRSDRGGDVDEIATRTDAQGAFRLSGVPLAPVEIEVTAPGYLPRRYGPLEGQVRACEVVLQPVARASLELALRGAATWIEVSPKEPASGPLAAPSAHFRLPRAARRFRVPENGTVVLDELPAGTYTTSLLDCNGARRSDGPPLELKWGARTKLEVVAAAEAPTLRGRLVDVDGVALAGRRLHVAAARWGGAAQATTAADGTFEVVAPVLAGAKLQVSLVDSDFALVAPRAGTQAGPLLESIADPAVPLEWIAAPAASLSGRVLFDDGTPAAGVEIVVEPYAVERSAADGVAASSPLAATTSDFDGTFELLGLAPCAESVGLRVSAPSAQQPSTPPDRYVLEAGRAIAGVTLVLPRRAEVRGRVVDRAGVPLAGMAVECFEGKRPRGTWSDAHGEFRFGDLDAGTTRLLAGTSMSALSWVLLPWLVTGEPQHPSGSDSVVELAAGEVRGDVELRVGLEPDAAFVRGRVSLASRWLAQSLAQPEVEVGGRSRRLPLGTIEAPLFDEPLASPTDSIHARSVTLDADGSTIVVSCSVLREVGDGWALLDLELPEPAATRMRARVVTATGQPCGWPMAWWIEPAGGGAHGPLLASGTNESPEGTVAWRGLAPGAYRLGFGADREAPRAAREFTLSAGDDLDFGDVALAATGTVRGTVVDANGAPIPGSWVGSSMLNQSLFLGLGRRRSGEALGAEVPIVEVAADGHFAIDDDENLVPTAVAPGFAPRNFDRAIEREVTVVLLPAGDIALTGVPVARGGEAGWRLQVTSLESEAARFGYPRTTGVMTSSRFDLLRGLFELPIGVYSVALWRGEANTVRGNEAAPIVANGVDSFSWTVEVRTGETTTIVFESP